MLCSQWLTFIQALISALQSTCNCSWSAHTQQGDGKTADLGTRSSLAAAAASQEPGGTLRPEAAFGSGLSRHKNHLGFVCPSCHSENWKLEVV